MIRNSYATELTKEYLEKLGINFVSKNGREIICGNTVLEQKLEKSTGYLYVSVYDPELYAAVYKYTRCRNAGTVKLLVHRVVYTWFTGKCKAGFVIDHKNDIKTDNNIDNLHEVTPGENIWKNREFGIREVKCNLDKPLEYYKNLVDIYKNEYEEAKKNHDAKRVHIKRSCISQYKAKIRYWLSHHE